MRRVLLSVVVLFACLVLHGCTGEPYVDGACGGETQDCRTSPNFAGQGTECFRNTCQCSGLFEVPCCPDGSRTNCPDAEFQCRDFHECVVATEPETVPPKPECSSDAECPKPHPWCGVSKCLDGSCTRDFLQWSPSLHQAPGDCTTLLCDERGALVPLNDPSDWRNDGQSCTIDLCDGPEAVNEPFPDGFPRVDADFGVCMAGEPYECFAPDMATTCPLGLVCDWRRCVPPTCNDNDKNGDETGLFGGCGGSCSPCLVGDECKVATDCESSRCELGKCAAASHTDGVKNDSEEGTDCAWAGAPPEATCAHGETCSQPHHCTSGVCIGGTCQEPTCLDATRNGGEDGPDCGGPCATPCEGQ